MGSLVAQFHHHNFVSIHKMGSRFTLLANISISASPHHTAMISQQEKLVSSYGLGTMAKVEKMSRSISSPKAEEVVSVDVSQAKTLLQSGHQYLDVRTPEEFRRGHCEAPKMVNIPYMLNTPQGRVKNQDFLEQVSSHLNPADDILVGCQSGARSLKATTELVAAGYKKVRNVGGGYMAWVDHSYPINKEEALAN